MRLPRIERHLFLCCDPTKAKCCSRKRSIKAWKFLRKRLKELGLAGSGGVWTRNTIGGGTMHDIEVGDVDADGDMDVVTRGHGAQTTVWLQTREG